jgi:hypothetical protein
VPYVVWRRPDETRLYSTQWYLIQKVAYFIINNMIFCLIEIAINKKGTHQSILSPKMPHHTLTLNRLWKFSSTATLLLLLSSNCFGK